MTIQEARKQINDAESKVTNAFSDMRSSAFSMTRSAESEAHTNTITKTLVPLIACLIGFFCCVAGSWGWGIGIILIIVGAALSYILHGEAAVGENKISNLTKNLSNQLEKYPKI